MTLPEPEQPDFVVTVPLAGDEDADDRPAGDPSRPGRPLGLFGLPEGFDPAGAIPYEVLDGAGTVWINWADG